MINFATGRLFTSADATDATQLDVEQYVALLGGVVITLVLFGTVGGTDHRGNVFAGTHHQW